MSHVCHPADYVNPIPLLAHGHSFTDQIIPRTTRYPLRRAMSTLPVLFFTNLPTASGPTLLTCPSPRDPSQGIRGLDLVLNELGDA